MDAFDELANGDVAETTYLVEPLLIGFGPAEKRSGLLNEFDVIGNVEYELADGDEMHAIETILGDGVRAGLRLPVQHFHQPAPIRRGSCRCGASARALALARARGSQVVTELDVNELRDLGANGFEVVPAAGESRTADAEVIATGAWLGKLARSFGVRQLVQAGHCYSFSVVRESAPRSTIDASTHRRIDAIINAARPMLTGIDWGDRQDEWVGSRPCTADGLPLIGASKSPRVQMRAGTECGAGCSAYFSFTRAHGTKCAFDGKPDESVSIPPDHGISLAQRIERGLRRSLDNCVEDLIER